MPHFGLGPAYAQSRVKRALRSVHALKFQVTLTYKTRTGTGSVSFTPSSSSRLVHTVRSEIYAIASADSFESLEMCLCNKMSEANKQKTPRTPRSPWRRHKEPVKPKLSRRIVPSARVNLNAYWSKFEELSKHGTSVVTFEIPSTSEILRSSMYSTFHDNEINENLVNELLELGKN
ncbi:hypothetical protein JTB14_028525 [Gonioctena quinquepunctata]|nr:hypothetical protein JTB14_028525 [Gonioctena quinquepunctata]